MRIKLILFLGIYAAGARLMCQLNYFNHCHATDALRFVIPYLPEDPVIVDAGAYDGKEIKEFFKLWPKCTVHAFEPIPENFKKLEANTQENTRVYRYQCALGDVVKEVDMYVSTEPPTPYTPSESSSLLPPHEHLKYCTTLFPYQMKVPCVTLDAWAAEHNIDHVDLLWLDLQGYELPVLQASPQVLRNVRAVLAEVGIVEVYKGQALFGQMKSWFESQGFVLIATNFNPDAPHVWYGDALFVRNI